MRLPRATRGALQQPDWAEDPRLAPVLAQLARLPPLVTPTTADLLTQRLAEVARGEAFLLQGGDCAETFAAATPAIVRCTSGILERMAAEIRHRVGIPVVIVGRMAGQYAKPRSRQTERRDAVELPAYRGDAVNDVAFTLAARAPDPRRLLRCHYYAGQTLRFLRRATSAEMFVSHESLLLDYELPLTRLDPRTRRWYSGSGHLLWVGERTRDPDGAHARFAGRIANPVAVKIGPSATPEQIAALVHRLDPDRVPGRLTFIARMGRHHLPDVLPGLVQQAQREGSPAAWVCDPMHGNTTTAPSGHKTRHVEDLLDELDGYFATLRVLGVPPAGVHLELTGEAVTECIGPAEMVRPEEVGLRYRSACDPRLNGDQSMLVAQTLADRLAYRGALDPGMVATRPRSTSRIAALESIPSLV
jgi:3-deoxy-7-phosphoheptulonate synthase